MSQHSMEPSAAIGTGQKAPIFKGALSEGDLSHQYDASVIFGSNSAGPAPLILFLSLTNGAPHA
jgi:hypothetical protein